MHLYGLNDLNMTLEEFLGKSSQIAGRKLKNEAMALAAKNDAASKVSQSKSNKPNSDLASHRDMATGTDPTSTQTNSFDLTDSNIYTAI